MNANDPQQVVNVTQKRGCLCCGTGCGVLAALPTIGAVAWLTVGAAWAALTLAAATGLLAMYGKWASQPSAARSTRSSP